ncbi:MAG: hypothetical protein FJ271_00325 [Planctomycetes bacterium]|nr:hypothetical protein [Planctomycetota bacterium]
MPHLRNCGFLSLAMFLAGPLLVHAAVPVIANVNVRGLRSGGTTTVTFDGNDFGAAPRLLLPFAARQDLKPKSTRNQATFDVTLDAAIVPGYYQARLLTEAGASLPVVIAVDDMPQLPFAAAIEQPLPVAMHGNLTGSTTLETRFTGKAGQKVLVEVEAQRLGSKLRPIVHLHDPKRRQVAWAWTTPALHGDARLEATLPQDGSYTLTIHDAEYAGQAPGHFRLRLGQWAYVDQVFPPVIAKGQLRALELLGMSETKRVELNSATTGVQPLNWPKNGRWSGPRPFVRVSARPEFVEQSSSSKLQELPTGAIAVSGRLLMANEEDRYRLAVVPGTKVKLDVFAERLGSPLDCALVIRNEKGELIARAEDGPGTLDPTLEYAVPAKTSFIVVGVVEAQGRGGPRGVYRLVVDPQQSPAPDWQLTTSVSTIDLPMAGRCVVPVWVKRKIAAGKIDLSAALPGGFKLEGNSIVDGADGTLMTIQRGTPSSDATLIHWRGKCSDGQERPVFIKDHPLRRLQPWLASEVALATTADKASDFQVDWRSLPIDAGIVPGRKLTLPVRVARLDPKTSVRLTLLTSQLPPLVNNQPDPNRTIRFEKTEELAAKIADGNPSLFIPAELPSPSYDLSVKAEMLAPDKRVLAVAYAPVRRLAVRMPVLVRLVGPPRLEKVLDPKKETIVKIAGLVERKEGLKSDVTVELKGLPPGTRAGAVNVKAGTTAFTIDLVLPPNLTSGEFRELRLSGTAVVDPKQPNVRVRSREVELTLVVKAGK